MSLSSSGMQMSDVSPILKTRSCDLHFIMNKQKNLWPEYDADAIIFVSDEEKILTLRS